MSELTNIVNLIVIKKVTETSKEKSFKKQESVGMTLAKVKEQDLKRKGTREMMLAKVKGNTFKSKTKYPYISGLIIDLHTYVYTCIPI